MEEFTSAESITKFLRGKKCPPHIAAQTARRLLAGEYSLFLPNSAMFVFDLICDRVSDLYAKVFASWKLSPCIWSLWHDIWQEMEKDSWKREIRGKSFRKAKFIQVISATLDEISGQLESKKTFDAENKQLLVNMFQCLELFSSTGYIEVDEHSAICLLKSYSYLLLRMDDQIVEEVPLDTWTGLIKCVYELPHQSAVYKPNKKSMNKYFTEVLPIHLCLFGGRGAIFPDETKKTLHVVFNSILFGLERSSLASQIASTFKNPPDYLDEAGVLYLFHEVILNLASSDIAACETIYLKLTTGKFSSMSEQLINVLSQVNKTLSPGVFAKLYSKEMALPKKNWTLISHFLKLDTELCLSKWKDVVSGSKNSSLSDLVLIGDNISSGFVRARDFPLFVSEVYPFALTTSNHWAASKVLAKLTRKVNEMSGNQMAKLGKQFLDSKSLKPMFLLVQGLSYCPSPKQVACQNLFVDYSFCHIGWAEVVYYVLCIYGESILLSQPDLVKKTVDTKKSASAMDLNLLLRVAELTGNTEHIDPKHVLTSIQSMGNDDIIPFAKRWIVLMGLIPGAYAQWCKKAFKSLPPQEILDFLGSHQVLLCELPLFLTDLSKFLQESSSSCMYKVISTFPTVIFRKFFGQILPLMCEKALEQPNNIELRSALRHVFQDPSLSSPFEKDFKTLQKLVATVTQNTREDTLAIFTSIWEAHMNSFKNAQSKEYVTNAVDTLSVSFDKAHPTQENLLILQVILSKKSAQKLDCFDTLLAKYVSIICKNMTTENLESSLNALRELPQLEANAKSTIVKAIHKFGDKTLSTQCRARLFTLVTKTSDVKDLYFVVALFLALHTEQANATGETLLADLTKYLRQLPTQDYHDIFALCIKDLRSGPSEFVPALVDVCCVLTSFFTKDQEDPSKMLLVAFISAFCDRHADLQQAAKEVLRFIKTITDLLSDHQWVFKQYTIELIWSTAHMLTFDLEGKDQSEEIYIRSLGLISQVILFHRFKLYSRYHLVIKVFSDLMEPISKAGPLSDSVAGASAFARVLTTLCEPPSQASSRETDELTSKAAKFKKALRRQAHVLLVNYIYVRLHQRFAEEVNDKLMPGIYSLFSLLKTNELRLVNMCLDSSGRAYYHTLYSTYQDHGKWKE